MRMTKLIILTAISMTSHFALASAPPPTVTVVDEDINFSLKNGEYPGPNQIFFGSNLFTFNDWRSRRTYFALKDLGYMNAPVRPKDGPLKEGVDYRPEVEIFEARSAAVVNRNVKYFSKETLHDINTILAFNNGDQNTTHAVIDANKNRFTIESRINFPPNWASVIELGRNAGIIKKTSTPYIEMVSHFSYFDESLIQGIPEVADMAKNLQITNLTPYALDIQEMKYEDVDSQGVKFNDINQIAAFGSIATLYYELPNNKTLLVSTFILAMKTHELNRGLPLPGFNFTGRALLMGQNKTMYPKDSAGNPIIGGIGYGLPAYSKEMFTNIYNALR